MTRLLSTLPGAPDYQVEYRQTGLPTVRHGLRSFHISHHALRRGEEMGVTLDTMVEVLTQGTLARNTPRSAHYKDGRGWLARHGGLSVALLENGPGDFTVTTVLWRSQALWDRWFDDQPETNRTPGGRS